MQAAGALVWQDLSRRWGRGCQLGVPGPKGAAGPVGSGLLQRGPWRWGWAPAVEGRLRDRESAHVREPVRGRRLPGESGPRKWPLTLWRGSLLSWGPRGAAGRSVAEGLGAPWGRSLSRGVEQES